MKDLLKYLLITAVFAQHSEAVPHGPLETNFEIGNEYQGDMKLSHYQEVLLSDDQERINRLQRRTGSTSIAKRWPKNDNGDVVVPYRFGSRDDEFSKVVKCFCDSHSNF